jgi:hypothetical protein
MYYILHTQLEFTLVQNMGGLLNPNVAGSSRQGCNPAGESPAMIIVRFGHVAIPQFWKATSSPLRGVNVLAARRTPSLRGRCNLGG